MAFEQAWSGGVFEDRRSKISGGSWPTLQTWPSNKHGLAVLNISGRRASSRRARPIRRIVVQICVIRTRFATTQTPEFIGIADIIKMLAEISTCICCFGAGLIVRSLYGLAGFVFGRELVPPALFHPSELAGGVAGELGGIQPTRRIRSSAAQKC